MAVVASGLDAIDASRLSIRTKNAITGLFIDNLRHDATRRCNELLLMLRLAEGASASDGLASFVIRVTDPAAWRSACAEVAPPLLQHAPRQA